MKILREELVSDYQDMSTEELLDHWESGTLTELATEIACNELIGRGVAPPPLVEQKKNSENEFPIHEAHFTTIARSFNATEMYILCGRLQADGIPAFVIDDNINQTNSLLAVATGGVRLQVEEKYAADALRLIEEVKAGTLMLADNLPEPKEDQSEMNREETLYSVRSFSPNWEIVLLAIIQIFALLEFGNTLWMAHTFNADINWDVVAIFAIFLPTLYLIAALMLLVRSKWSVHFFTLHLVTSIASFLLLTKNDYLPLNQILGWLCTTGVIYFCIHLQRRGRLA